MEKGLKDPHQIPMLVEMDGEPLGYYEMYWVPEDRLGLIMITMLLIVDSTFLSGIKNS